MSEQPPRIVEIPADLALVPLDELKELASAAKAEFTALEQAEVTPDNVTRAVKLQADLRRVKDEIKVKEAREAAAAAREKEALESQMKDLGNKVHDRAPAEGGTTEGGTETSEVAAELPAKLIEQIVAAAAQGTAAVLTAADGGRRFGTDLAQRVSTSLAEANRHVPDPQVPDNTLTVVASVDVPGRAQGESLTFDDLVDAFEKRARALPVQSTGMVASGVTVATIRQEYPHTVDDRTSLGQIDELFHYLQNSQDAETLLAGGGWCAPSEVRYNFFNVACEDGEVDLPTFGVSRGGVRFPVSPSLADFQLAPFVSAFSNTSVPWLWTETDDILTVTGTTNKPCFRVPCPTFDERRLECYGICVTAGNLADDAYPESTANTIRLVNAAHTHAMNARTLAIMASLSTAATTLAGGTDNAFNSIVGGLSLAATDYRARYGMCADDVLEVVIPYWTLDAIQADLAWRTGDFEFLSVTKQRIRQLLADRNLRPQFVGDWQVRGAGQPGNAAALTAWPTTVTAMVYAAGTFLRGNGLTLDLGVVRDSVLNAENDHTAAWSEECRLVARVGHESRQYTITFNVGGNQGASLGTPPGF